MNRGSRVVRKQLNTCGKYSVYQNSLAPLGYYEKYNRSADTTFVIGAGAAGEIGYSYNEFWAADDCYTFDCPEYLNSRYLYYFLMTKKVKINSQVRKSSIPRLPKGALEQLIIPIPPLDEQERIVSILDRFDTLCNDISKGIPAEIEARQKQYEYYRERLLNFNNTDGIKDE